MTAGEEGLEGVQVADASLDPPAGGREDSIKTHYFQTARCHPPPRRPAAGRVREEGETSLPPAPGLPPKLPGDPRVPTAAGQENSRRAQLWGRPTLPSTRRAHTHMHTPLPPDRGGPATGRPPAEPLRPSSLHRRRGRAFRQRRPFTEKVWFLLSVFSLFIQLLMQSYHHACCIRPCSVRWGLNGEHSRQPHRQRRRRF